MTEYQHKIDILINIPNIDHETIEVLNAITKKHTAFANFMELVTAPGNYRPTINILGRPICDALELSFLVLYYNKVQSRAGDPRRVFGDHNEG